VELDPLCLYNISVSTIVKEDDDPIYYN
jgi:hypothetical protein